MKTIIQTNKRYHGYIKPHGNGWRAKSVHGPGKQFDQASDATEWVLAVAAAMDKVPPIQVFYTVCSETLPHFCAAPHRGAGPDPTDHGFTHWERVFAHGLRIAAHTPEADTLVIAAFAALHDCCRMYETRDDYHGERAAEYAKELHRQGHLPLSKAQLNVLCRACLGHAGGQTSRNPTIGCCWDADRMDLPRVGITPTPNLMSTIYGKTLAKHCNKCYNTPTQKETRIVDTKLAQLRKYLAQDEPLKALKLAATWPRLGEHKARIQRGWAAHSHPRFFQEIGKDPDALVADGIAAVRERYQAEGKASA